jgi:hypothetical protein
VKDPASAANPALVALDGTLTSLYDSVTPAWRTAVAAGGGGRWRRMQWMRRRRPAAGAAPLRDEAVCVRAASGANVRVCIAGLCADLAAVPGRGRPRACARRRR